MSSRFDWSKGSRMVLVCSRPKTYICLPKTLSKEEIEAERQRYLEEDGNLKFQGMVSYLS